jgi:aminotransferase EvaB
MVNHFPSWSFRNDVARNEEEYLEAIRRVLHSDRLLLGGELKKFEEEFANFIGTDYGIGCDNATNGIFLALKALDISNGDKVLTVANTAIPTVSAIVQAGAIPIFCDVDSGGQMDIDTVDRQYLEEAKAVIPVYLFGFSPNIERVIEVAHEYDLKIIEDCSQAHGTQFKGQRVGSFGDLAVFSFYPTKSLGGFGDAGMILTKSLKYSDRLRRLRFYGVEEDYYAVETGYNSRMDEMHAAILRVKLTRLTSNIEHRSAICKYYRERIDHPQLHALPYREEVVEPSNYLVPFIFTGNRDYFAKVLQDRGIYTNISYKHPIHLMRAYKDLGYLQGSLPRTEYLCDHVISFPLYDYIDGKDVEIIVDEINSLANYEP